MFPSSGRPPVKVHIGILHAAKFLEEGFMCDYSLMEYQNRLAVEGEVLMVHRFQSGSLGLASPEDHCRIDFKPARVRNFWGAVREFFHPAPAPSAPAVCIPPGASLILHDVTPQVQKALGVCADEDVRFVQMSAASHTYRDAVRFRNGQTLCLQELREGQRVKVVDLGYSTPEEPIISGIPESLPVLGAPRRF
jgi:hypothetical protein